MITDFIKALLGVGSHIYSFLGGSRVSSAISTYSSQFANSDVTSTIKGFVSKLYYFVPKEIIVAIVSAMVAILVIRILLAIVAEVWFG